LLFANDWGWSSVSEWNRVAQVDHGACVEKENIMETDQAAVRPIWQDRHDADRRRLIARAERVVI